MRQVRQALPRLCKQGQEYRDRRAEEQVLDCKARLLVLAGQVSQVLASHREVHQVGFRDEEDRRQDSHHKDSSLQREVHQVSIFCSNVRKSTQLM